jgi:hypothetical protein
MKISLNHGTKQRGIIKKGASPAVHAKASHKGPSILKCEYATYANMAITARE